MRNLHVAFYNECTDYHFLAQCTVFLFLFILTNISWGVIIIILTPCYSFYSYTTSLKQVSKYNTLNKSREGRAKSEGLNFIHFYFKCVCLYIFVWCMCRCVHTTAYVETGHNFVELFFSLVWILEMEFTLLGLLGRCFYPMSHLAA